MNHEKALYFITREKRMRHIGFFSTLSQVHLLESKELLEKHGFSEDPAFLRETDDSAYVFSSFLPLSAVDRWFAQIIREKSTIMKAEKKREKMKGKNNKKEMKKPVFHTRKSRSRSTLHVPRSRRKPYTTVEKIQNIRALKQKNHHLPRIKIQKDKKSVDALKEEIRAQRRWETLVPTCSECVFWENQILEFTQVEIGGCKVTGNFVSPEKTACSEFERRR
jgi:hypothetical protein